MAESDEDFLVTVADWRKIRGGSHYCVAGVRLFCGTHGFSFNDFIRNGVSYSRISHIKNAMLDEVIAVARERNRQEKLNGSV